MVSKCEKSQPKQEQSEASTKSSVNAAAVRIPSVSQSSKKQTVSLEQVFRKEMAIHLFMLHLSREFSMECLLSYIELNQYLVFVRQNCEDIIWDDNKYEIIDFPTNIPLSGIITEQKGKEDMDITHTAKKAACKLYEKYIRIGSEFEVNIHHSLRTRCYNILNNAEWLVNNGGIGLQDICELFEKIKQEMFLLLQYSISRFKYREEWTKIEELFTHHHDIRNRIISIPRKLTASPKLKPVGKGMDKNDQIGNNDREPSKSLDL